MSVRTALFASVVGLSLAACGGGITVNTDYDPAAGPAMAAYKTYSWLPSTQHQGDQLTSARIKGAVDNQLAAKGFRKIEGDAADFRVTYILALEGKVDYTTTTSGTGYGYGGWYGRGGIGMTSSRTTATEWTQGTLAIDIIDGKKSEMVFRSVGQAEVTPDLTPAERSERVNEAVLEMLRDFPPK